MTGPAYYSRDADAASAARARMDETAELVESMKSVQRSVVASLAEMWPTSAWLAAGVRSAKQWLIAYTDLSALHAGRFERIGELCARDERLCAAVADGDLSLGRAETLARAVTDERAPWLADVVPSFLGVQGDDDTFAAAVRYWCERVDELLAPRRVQAQSLTFSARLFGGGDIHGTFAPGSFENISTAIHAFSQDPDPADAPYVRTQSERWADGLDDMASFALTHDNDLDGGELSEEDSEDEMARAEDTYDGSYPGDSLDEALLPENEGLDELELLRARIRKADRHQRRRAMRRVRGRSGVTVNVHIDLHTLAGARTMADLDGLVLRGEGWNLAKGAAEQLLCDSALVATLFAGQTEVLDANDAAERFSKRQRRAIAARDHHCVFPGCTRQPRHCDTHHLEERNAGGPTVVGNGCLLCRFHHRLLHQHRWTLRRGSDGWVATDPHGVEWKGRPAQPAAA